MKKSVIICIIAMFCFVELWSQNSREHIRNCIANWGECRNVAITKYNGDLALYGRNGYASRGCPSNLCDAISELNNSREYIRDVQLTDGGSWLIIYGNNGLRWCDIPYSLESTIKGWNNNGEIIQSVTFNDADQWVAVSDKHIHASDAWIQDWLAEGMRTYGGVYTVCITDDAMVAVYENGYRFYGNVPEGLKTALTRESYDVYHVKISGTAWFYSDGKNRYNYHM